MEPKSHKRPTEIEVCKSYRLTRDPIYRRFSRDMIAAMLADENKKFFISFFCSSTRSRTFFYCSWCL